MRKGLGVGIATLSRSGRKKALGTTYSRCFVAWSPAELKLHDLCYVAIDTTHFARFSQTLLGESSHSALLPQRLL